MDDFITLFSSPTYESLEYWILKGEQSTWPHLATIRNRLMIEVALDDGLNASKSPSTRNVDVPPDVPLQMKRKSVV